MQKVVAFVGVSGVGKSTFLRELALRIEFQHLQASVLIREERIIASQTDVIGDKLRLANIEENQILLINAVERSIDRRSKLVILDGHTVVDTPSGLTTIDPDVFKRIGISELIFLSDHPSSIFQHREKDIHRQRPVRDEETLRQHQEVALLSAFTVSLALKIPLYVVNSGCAERVAELLG